MKNLEFVKNFCKYQKLNKGKLIGLSFLANRAEIYQQFINTRIDRINSEEETVGNNDDHIIEKMNELLSSLVENYDIDYSVLFLKPLNDIYRKIYDRLNVLNFEDLKPFVFEFFEQFNKLIVMKFNDLVSTYKMLYQNHCYMLTVLIYTGNINKISGESKNRYLRELKWFHKEIGINEK